MEDEDKGSVRGKRNGNSALLQQMLTVSESRTSSLLTKGHLECLEQF